jgi:hypothetical protein
VAGRVRFEDGCVDHGDGVKDALDAQARARSSYRRDWHPLLSAVETEPGVWVMVAQFGEVYGIVRLIRVGEEVGYRAVTAADRRADRTLIGYYTSLRAACQAAHDRWVRHHGTQGGVNGKI